MFTKEIDPTSPISLFWASENSSFVKKTPQLSTKGRSQDLEFPSHGKACFSTWVFPQKWHRLKAIWSIPLHLDTCRVFRESTMLRFLRMAGKAIWALLMRHADVWCGNCENFVRIPYGENRKIINLDQFTLTTHKHSSFRTPYEALYQTSGQITTTSPRTSSSCEAGVPQQAVCQLSGLWPQSPQWPGQNEMA